MKMQKAKQSSNNPSLLELKLHLMNVINEAGDLENIEAYPHKDGTFETEEGWKVTVGFETISKEYIDYFKLPANTINVSYSIQGNQSQYEKTTYSKLIKILKTVSDIVIEYIKANKDIKGLAFFAANKDANKLMSHTDPQKTAIYKAIVLSRLSKLGPGWTVRDLKVDNGYKGFIIYKKMINENSKDKTSKNAK